MNEHFAAVLTRVGRRAMLSFGLLMPTLASHAVAQAGALSKAPAAGAPLTLLGRWRVQRGVVAPWVKDKNYHPDVRSWVGKYFTFDAKRVAGVSPLQCGGAHYEATSMPPDGLFMGGLLKPQKAAAQTLGFKTFPVRGTSLDCDAGVFEFHYADANAVLVAVDNVIWTLDRSPGALADSGSPAMVVQQFLERHFAGEMGFDAASVASKRQFLSDPLQARIAQYFKKPANPNEVPAIDGDPFTDSQEYPTRFSVELPVVEGARMAVSVRMSDAYRTRVIRYILERQGAQWRIADVRYGKGEPTLLESLK